MLISYSNSASMEATQTYNLCPDEDDIEDAMNEDGVIDTTTEDDVDGIPLTRHDIFSISLADVTSSRGTIMQSPSSREIESFVPVVQESPQSLEVAEVQVHPLLVENNEHHEVPSE